VAATLERCLLMERCPRLTYVILAKRAQGSRELESRPVQSPLLVEALGNNGDDEASPPWLLKRPCIRFSPGRRGQILVAAGEA